MTDDERIKKLADAAEGSQKFAEKIIKSAEDAASKHQKMIEDIRRPNKIMEEFMRPQELMEKVGQSPDEYLKVLIPQRDQMFRQFDPAVFVTPNAASEFQKRLVEWITDFERSLDQERISKAIIRYS